jgi:peptidoglycan-associated lipoprotein
MKHLLSAIVLGTLLAGCASTKLDESATGSATAATPATTAPRAASQVAPVVANTAPSNANAPTAAARTIYFDYDSDAIRPEFQAAIDAHARYLSRQRGRTIAIAGHTDERGGREYNLALGQRRAEAVKRALHLLGVTDVQVETISLGEEKPADAGHDEAAWSHNRRAEIVYR